VLRLSLCSCLAMSVARIALILVSPRPPPLLFHQFNLSPYLHHYATLRNSYSRAPYGPRPGTLQLIVCLLHTPLFSFLCLRRLGWVGLGESFLFFSSLLRLLIILVLLSFDSRSLARTSLILFALYAFLPRLRPFSSRHSLVSPPPAGSLHFPPSVSRSRVFCSFLHACPFFGFFPCLILSFV
jgi:hypothetical protein